MALKFNKSEVEKIVIKLAKSFKICLLEKTAHYSLVTGGMTVLGHLMGGRLGAIVGGALGYHLAGASERQKLTFEQFWTTLGDKGLPLLKRVFKRLRVLGMSDYAEIAAKLAVSRNMNSLKYELADMIKNFLIEEFGKNVVSEKCKL